MGTDVGRTGRGGASRRRREARVVHKGDGTEGEEGEEGDRGPGIGGRERRGRRRRRRRPSGLKSSIARIFAVTSRKSCDRPLVYCTSSSCRLPPTSTSLPPPPSPLRPLPSSPFARFFARERASRSLSFILHSSPGPDDGKGAYVRASYLFSLLAPASLLPPGPFVWNIFNPSVCCTSISIPIRNRSDTRVTDARITRFSVRIYTATCHGFISRHARKLGESLSAVVSKYQFLKYASK